MPAKVIELSQVEGIVLPLGICHLSGIFVAYIFLLSIIFFIFFSSVVFLNKDNFYFHLLVYNYVPLYHVFYGYDGFI